MLGVSAASPALAQPSVAGATSEAANLDLARSVAVTGREAFNAGDYETALALFRRAHSLFPAPTVVLYEARTLEKMGLLLESVEAYARITRVPLADDAPEQFEEAVEAARSEGDAVRARIPTLILEVRGSSEPGLLVSLNGQALAPEDLGRARSLNPGTYRILGFVGKEQRASVEVTLVAGQTRRIQLDLVRLDSPLDASDAAAGEVDATSVERRRPIPLLAFLAGGVGVVGVGAGVISGVLANSKYSEAERLCEDRRCTSNTPGTEALDAFRTWRMVSSVSYGVGAAGIAAGIVLWLTASDDDETGQVGHIEPWGTGKTVGVRGTF